MFSLNGNGHTGVSPIEAIESLTKIVGAIDREVVFATCIDADGFVSESECFASDCQPKNLLPVEELFYLACSLDAPMVMITSRSSGPIAQLHDCDVDFTARVIDTGIDLGVDVFEHVLVEKDCFRLMTESAPELWRERGLMLERDPQDDVEELEDTSQSQDVPGEGADRQGDPEPGEPGSGQSERAEK